MQNDTKRWIGAVLIAIGAIGTLLWLAVARLSPDAAFGAAGWVAAAAAIGSILLGVRLVRRKG